MQLPKQYVVLVMQSRMTLWWWASGWSLVWAHVNDIADENEMCDDTLAFRCSAACTPVTAMLHVNQ